MANEVKKFYEFGKFRFDAQKLRLEYDGASVQLPPKASETLKVLLEEKGETITREDFLEKIWAESFVEDANLTVAVSILRKTLAVYEKDETFIQTVTGRGYRFVGDALEKIEIAEKPIVIQRHAVEQLTIEETSAPALTARKFPRTYFLLFALFGLIVAFGAFAFWQRGEKAAAVNLSDNPEANEAFLKGDALLQKREVCESVPHFREAVAKDENFARAYSNLAASLAMCDFTDEIDEIIARALWLDPNLAEAHATDGFIKMFRHWDWDGAEAALRRSVALDPNSAKAHHWLGVCLSIRGRWREAVGEMRRAIELEPDSPLYHADLGQLHYFGLHDDAAVIECQKALELDPNFFIAHRYLRDVYLRQGDERQAWEHDKKHEIALRMAAPEGFKESEEIFGREGYKGLYEGEVNGALDNYNRVQINSKQQSSASFSIADFYTRLGDKENALVWLEKSVGGEKGTHPFWMAYIGVDPRFAFLRDEPRFQAVLRRMNLTN